MKTAYSIPVFVCLAALAGCGPVADQRARDVDLRPPLVQAVETSGPREISVEFDEDASLEESGIRISPALAVTGVTGPGKLVIIKEETQTPGQRYTLEAEARDVRGNSASFMAEVYGFNGRVPRLLINEFTPRGSGNHPDLVEVKVLSAGNMGGVVVFQGTPGNFDARLVFPAFPVTAGTFILVHCRPSGEPGEVDEKGDMTASQGLDTSDTAWDFWLPEGRGIGGTNGVLSLYERPGGKCIDGVLYSTRTSQSDEKYRGFGSEEMLARAEELVRDGGWKPAGARLTPEDAVSPEGSTGTRSICRGSSSGDTDTASDWHIVPTRGATFGAENSNETWVP
jgi:hypothetical protein